MGIGNERGDWKPDGCWNEEHALCPGGMREPLQGLEQRRAIDFSLICNAVGNWSREPTEKVLKIVQVRGDTGLNCNSSSLGKGWIWEVKLAEWFGCRKWGRDLHVSSVGMAGPLNPIENSGQRYRIGWAIGLSVVCLVWSWNVQMGMCSTDDIMSLQHSGEVSTGDTESGTVKARNVPKINKHGLWWKKRNGLRKTSSNDCVQNFTPSFWSCWNFGLCFIA